MHSLHIVHLVTYSNNKARKKFTRRCMFDTSFPVVLFDLMLYVHGKQLRSCRDGQFKYYIIIISSRDG